LLFVGFLGSFSGTSSLMGSLFPFVFAHFAVEPLTFNPIEIGIDTDFDCITSGLQPTAFVFPTKLG